jgi:hypothetical protein
MKYEIWRTFHSISLLPDGIYSTPDYYIPAKNEKSGGRYVTVSGNVKMLNGIEHAIIMADRTKIPIEDVRYIEGDLFRLFE